MDELYSSIFLHQELQSVDEMRLTLQSTLLELEALKIEANEKARIHQKEVTHLLNLLKLAQEERDEAKQHLAHLGQNPNNCPMFLPTTTDPKSSISESNSFSQSSSPSSPELSSLIDLQYQPLILEDPTAQMDPLDDLVKGKTLPETGKLLKAVVEAGPLLETLIVAGTLPRWTTPPPQPQGFAVPPVSIRGFHVSFSRRCDPLTPCTASVPRFGLGSVPVMDNQMLTGKRRRFE